MPENHSYGWRPQHPDQRDYLLTYELEAAALPPRVDLRPQCPPVYDQGQLGSCTANAIAAAVQFEQIKQGIANWTPSRLLIYYDERVIEGTVKQDAGAMIRDGMKSVAKTGACPESDWPYIISKFATKPPAKAFADAGKHKVGSYLAVQQTQSAIKSCLAAGYPVVFGFSVYESFESAAVAQTGVVPMPAPHEGVLGGHAVLAVGYDDALQRFIVRNSWGSGWGQAGYCTMPFQYLTSAKLASDFWSVRMTA